MLRQGLDRYRVTRIDFDLRLQRPAEISPMHARRLYRKVMVTALAFGAPGNHGCLLGRRAFLGVRQWMMAAQLRERLLRPAALTGHSGGDRRALDYLLTKFAGRKPESMTERPAEMRGIIEAIAVGNLRDRMVRLGRIRELRRCSLQPALAQIVREAASRALEQLLHIPLGYSLKLRHPRRSKIGITKLALDCLAKAVKDCRLRRRTAGICRRRHELPYERRQQVGKALGDCGPFQIGKRLEISRFRFQRTREHLGETAGRQDPDVVEYRIAYFAPMKRS